jgi:hypothetical protein
MTKQNQKLALVIPARGIGDALLMMIASEALHQEGYCVTTIHPALGELQEWFPQHNFSTGISALDTFDLVIVENDNSSKMGSFKNRPQVSIFYPTYLPEKHGPLSSLDQVFDPTKPFAENVQEAMKRLLKRAQVSRSNGIRVPSGLKAQKFDKRVLLHPLSSAQEKNWKKEKYLSLANRLKKQGFEPVFVVSPNEREEFLDVEKRGFSLPQFSTLNELARFTYESGFVIGNDSLLGHLGSNLGLTTLIVADDPKRMQLWRPGWALSELITPPFWIPNFKWLRLRKKKWQSFISVRKVFRTFCNLAFRIH